MWVVIALAVFIGLTWLGRQVRLGRWPSGPWIKQFRAVRSVLAMGCLAVGLIMLARGLWPEGLGALFLALILGGSVRFHAAFQSAPRGPQTAATYTVEEVRAYQTLGLAVGADRKAIKEAWKRLMKAAHPDQGGAEERAKALNAARDVLLKRAR